MDSKWIDSFDLDAILNNQVSVLNSNSLDIIDKVKERVNKEYKGSVIYDISRDNFSVEDARDLSQELRYNGTKDNPLVFFISIKDSFSQEAQNALLKVLEEPNKNTYLYIFIPKDLILIETVMSRVKEIKVEPVISDEEVENFLSMTIKERLEYIESFFKDISKEQVSSLLNSMERVIHQNLKSKKDALPSYKLMNAIYVGREHLRDRSVSIKQLLKYIAISV